jgi:hypothetical protein
MELGGLPLPFEKEVIENLDEPLLNLDSAILLSPCRDL